jgi:hypothetical protein
MVFDATFASVPSLLYLPDTLNKCRLDVGESVRHSLLLALAGTKEFVARHKFPRGIHVDQFW